MQRHVLLPDPRRGPRHRRTPLLRPSLPSPPIPTLTPPHQAGSGIGRGAANALALAGATAIIFADIDLASAQHAAESSRAHATDPSYTPLALHLDVTSPGSVDAAVQTTVARFARIDYLVNSAGVDVHAYARTPDLDAAEYARVMDVNVKGALLVSQAVVRVMQSQTPRTFTLPVSGERRELARGSIVNVASALGYLALPGKGAYTVSKHAAIGLTKQMGEFTCLPTRPSRSESAAPGSTIATLPLFNPPKSSLPTQPYTPPF